MSLVENTSNKLSPTLSCSGSLTITYSIGSYNAQNVPSWILVDNTTGLVNVKAPSMNSTSDFSFYIVSSIQGYSSTIPKLITIRVNKWNVSDCQTWVQYNSSWWSTWNSGFLLSACSWFDPNKDTAKAVETANIGTKSAVGFVTAIIVVSNL